MSAEPTAFETFYGEAAEKVFLRNAAEGRENGYDLLCAECGVGLYDDGDLHDSHCSQWDQEGWDAEMRAASAARPATT